MPIFFVNLSPNTRNWQSFDPFEISTTADQMVEPIINEFKKVFKKKPGLIRISKNKRFDLKKDIITILQTYSECVKEEIKQNGDNTYKRYEKTISILKEILGLALKIEEEHVFLFESYLRKYGEDHFLSDKGKMDIKTFIVYLESMIEVPRGRRSNYAVNCTADPCITLIENFLNIKFPKTINASGGGFLTHEAQFVLFILKLIEKDITISKAHTALKHAIKWRKKSVSGGNHDT